MIDILNSIKEAAKESSAFESHAAKGLPLEDRLLYLQGLALVMNADGEIHKEEKDYLVILIKSFDLDESILESCIDFANQPDKSTIQSVLKCFKRKPIAQLFLFDALMISYRDGEISEEEREVIDELAFQFEVAKGIYQDIFDLFCYIKNRNWQDASMYLSIHLLNPNYFKHIFNYYDIELNVMLSEFDEISNKKLSSLIKNRFKDGISNEDLLPFLQSKIDRREASVQNGIYISTSFDDVEISDIDVFYNQLDDNLYVSNTCLIKSSSILDNFLEGVVLTETERYKLYGGNKKVVSSVILDNLRLLKLDEGISDGDLIDIEGALWEFKKLKSSKNTSVKGCLVSNSKNNFKKLDGLIKLQLHSSLTDKLNFGNLIRFHK
ncbi:TPA: TerB family tellurite resistance protein [Vibrio vulnificus]|nr:TerB family tellurite resistance protein [Vibrio vulnificus]HDY7669323.1 TerB family tellurite resistance protein [Vibrio vulnificus]